MLIEARNDSETFLVQYAPYNYTATSLQCSIDYDDPSHYVYSVGIDAQQTSGKQPSFFVAGEVLPPPVRLGKLVMLRNKLKYPLNSVFVINKVSLSMDFHQIENSNFTFRGLPPDDFNES